MNWCFMSLVVQEVQSRIIFSAFRLGKIKEKSIPNVGGYCKYACVSTDEACLNLYFSVEGYINIWNVSILWTKDFTSRNLFQECNYEYVLRFGYSYVHQNIVIIKNCEAVKMSRDNSWMNMVHWCKELLKIKYFWIYW